MCNYKNLVHTEHGYVVKCKSCGHMHVAFGTTILRFAHHDFLEFVKETELKLKTNKHTCTPGAKAIQIDTANKNVGLIYSYNELKHLSGLLQSATDELSKQELYNFCYN